MIPHNVSFVLKDSFATLLQQQLASKQFPVQVWQVNVQNTTIVLKEPGKITSRIAQLAHMLHITDHCLLKIVYHVHQDLGAMLEQVLSHVIWDIIVQKALKTGISFHVLLVITMTKQVPFR